MACRRCAKPIEPIELIEPIERRRGTRRGAKGWSLKWDMMGFYSDFMDFIVISWIL